ncbi:MAG: MFS transporter [Nocardioides sp.]
MTVSPSLRGTRWLRYRTVLGDPSVRWLMLWGLVARLREGGIGLALVLLVQHAAGSFTLAGVVGAAFYAAGAIMRPVQGRWMDRRGHREVLLVTGLANALLLTTLVVVADGGRTWLLIAVAALAGGSMPATSSALRSLWPTLVAEGVHEATYALDSLLYELAIVIGPALVGLISAAAQPGWAVIALVCAGLFGNIGIALVAAGHRTRHPADSGATRRRGVLDPRFLTLIAVAFFVGGAEGPLTVAITAAAVRDQAGAFSGLLVSAIAAGSILGLLLYGARDWKSSSPTRLVACTVALTASLLLLAAAAASTAVLAVAAAAIFVGIAVGPAINTIALFVNVAAPREHLAEAFAWISFATPCGAAATQSFSGILVSGPGPALGILAGALCAATAAAFATSARRGFQT